MSDPAIAMPDSLWTATADPLPALSPLDRDIRAEVAIIGGGYTGLSAARELAKRGVEAVLVDAGDIAGGASGRNGGFVSSRFRVSFLHMLKRHGRDVARRMFEIGREGAAHVARTAEELGLRSTDFARHGTLYAAFNERQLRAAQDSIAWMEREFGAAPARILSRAEIAAESGSTLFVGGTLAVAGAGVHPLNYARGLARDLHARGVPLFPHSPATAIRREGDTVVVVTPAGRVRAGQVILGTNAYSRISPVTARLARRVIPFQSAVIATSRLPPALLERILPARRMVFDSKRVLRWWRIFDDRMVFGGRGASGNEGSEAAYARLQAGMVSIHPELREVPLEYRWSGYVGMSLDGLPHVGRLDDRLLFAAAYNGSGVSLASLLGTIAARMAQGEEPDLALLRAERFRPMPFVALQEPAVRLGTHWHLMLDALGR